MTHEFDGKRYAQASAHQQQWGAKLIEEMSLRGDERVLDLGCGDGAQTALIAELVPHGEVVGIDASRGMIEAAKPKESERLHFILMDMMALDFDEEFDAIYSNAALHWVREHDLLLPRMLRALCPGGSLYLNFAADGNCSNFHKVIRQAMAQDEFAFFFEEFTWPWYMPSIDEYTGFVQGQGLQQVRIWGENRDRYFPDAETMVGWLDQPSLVPFLSCLPETHKPAFRDYVIEQMLKLTRQNDGRCFETFRRINVIASKA